MARATTWVEREGIPAVGIICTGFVLTARTVAEAEGLAEMRLVEYPPPNVAVQRSSEVQERAAALLDHLVASLTRPAGTQRGAAAQSPEADPRESVFKGSLEEVNEFFREKGWTDGLPVMPPTPEAVSRMLRYTDRDPREALAVLVPGKCQATVWNVAVNGVMAGCRPEYLPVLLALTEAIADPAFQLERAGSTSGRTPLIILNGPLIKQLAFNSGPGVLRPQRQANITVARFLRLGMLNIAGFSIDTSDRSTFGNNYIPVLAEAEDESPWPPLSLELGFTPGSNVVSVLQCVNLSAQFVSMGVAADHLRVLASEVAREVGAAVCFLARHGAYVSSVICLSPLVASRIADGGYSRNDIRRYLFENARIPAREFDEQLASGRPTFTACQAVKSGKLPALFCETTDPGRMLPVVRCPEEFLVVVAGDKFRNRSFIAPQSGPPVSREVKLPQHYDRLLEESCRVG